MNQLIPLTLTTTTVLSTGILFPVQAAEFRSIDGTNNNPNNATWGSVGTNLIRLSGVGYDDGMSVPRGGLNPSILPSPRAISNAISAQSNSIPNAANVSDWVWQWGQFLDHDLDLSPIGTTEPFNIAVPTGDPFFDPDSLGEQTINFNRSEFNVDSFGVRQQFNEITAYIDASNIYGSDVTRTNQLRTNDGTGQLIAETAVNGEKLLMLNTGGLPNDTRDDSNPEKFFLSGDVRANEQVGLLASHTLFMREHNRLADQIKTRLEGGDTGLVEKLQESGLSEGDFIFESARKVVGAQMQVITYNQWLPLVLGENALDNYSGYNQEVDPGISTEFSTAAFRFGHTMLSPELLRVDNNGNMVNTLSLRESFFNPEEIQQNGIDTLLRGLASQKAEDVDTFLVDDVRNFLFGPPGAGGFDLASLNLQRGRDHGLPDINTVRLALGLMPYSSFLQLTGGDETLAAAFARVYNTVDEVDLWIAGLGEKKINGGLLGETFSRILSDQFTRSRDGDRFFYLNDLDHLTVLDPTLETVTLSQIIRRNSTIQTIQDNAFLVTSVPEPNSKVPLFLVVFWSLVRCNFLGRIQRISKVGISTLLKLYIIRNMR
ncbi:peroxidase family protein [Crocosphaera sp.]|uniref:peroxidase family protein n=1 Tax=Crocosphaera sp. TaxID=2729996 RepID=UPI003F242B3D|nr:peroxidase family protein [Crocosphaera sp.]